jgi:hypothetical protein
VKPTPSEDKVLRDVRQARQSDVARGTGPKVPAKRNNQMAISSVSPEPTSEPSLHEAFTSVADRLMEEGHRPATLGNIAYAFHSVANKIGRSQAPEPVTIGERDTSGLFSTPKSEAYE